MLSVRRIMDKTEMKLEYINYGRAGSEYRILSDRTYKYAILNFLILESGHRIEVLGARHLIGPGETTRSIAHFEKACTSITGLPRIRGEK